MDVSTLALLIDKHGRQIASPKTVEATVSWRASDSVAQAFTPSGQLVAELHCARIDWLDVSGLRIVGMEPNGTVVTKYRAQSWHYKP